MKANTRVAPSPTGDMHLGTARVAYFNWLVARATGGRFILRIDDTDLERNNEEHVNTIYKVLAWLGLDYDSTFRQSQRMERYHEVASKLIEANLAVRTDNGGILFTPSRYPDLWTDTIVGNIRLTDKDKSVINNMVLFKGKDGQPTYHFASVIDDIDTQISWIIRGDDHKTNTAKHVTIHAAINEVYGNIFPDPLYSHVGLIMKNGKKMSKRDGESSMLKYMEEGVPPAAILNYLLRVGWGPREDNKFNTYIDKERAKKMFLGEGRMKSAPASFDQAKLNSMIKHYSK